MDDLWGAPLTPQNAPSSASETPSSLPPESNGAPKQSVNSLAVVQTVSIGKRKRSPYWVHFDKVVVNGLPKAVCKYCSRNIGCDPRSGTTPLKNHILRCKEYSPKSISNGTPEQSPPPAAAVVSAVPWDKFPAARTVQQMREEPSAEGNGYKIKETETGYKIRFDMPGMTRNDVRVWVEENVLVVEAEKKPKKVQDGEAETIEVEDYEWPVESYGKYNSRIALPETVEVQRIKAEVKDGVLYIAIPKARAKCRKIEINVQ